MHLSSKAIAFATISLLVLPLPSVAQSTTLALIREEVEQWRCTQLRECETGPAQLIEVNVEGARFVSRTPVPFERNQSLRLTATADGRYLVWLSDDVVNATSRNLAVFDRATGGHDVVFRSAPGNRSRYPNLLAHPTSTRVFAGLDQSSIVDAGTGGFRELTVGAFSQQLDGMTADGHLVLISHRDPAIAQVVDVDTGATISQIAGYGDGPGTGNWAIAPDGAFVYGFAYRYLPDRAVQVFSRYDATTGTLLAEREHVWPAPFEPILSVDIDPRTGRLFVHVGDGRFRVLDPLTLERVGLVATPLVALSTGSNPVRARLAFDPQLPRAFLLANRPRTFSTSDPGISRIDIVDTGTLGLIGGASLDMEVGPDDLVVVPRPAAPTALTATVEGARVTLQFTPGVRPGAATGFRVEAGSAPGLSDLATLSTDHSQMTVDDVPRGRYYVRVRATNWGGASEASPEIVVIVP